MNYRREKDQSGQTVLIILLIVAVILTIGLSTISSSTTDIKVSQQTEESSRAYYVAESGLEEAFLLNAAPTGTIGNIQYDVTKTSQGGNTEFLFPYKVSAGDPQTVWLIGHTENGAIDNPATSYREADGKLKVCWGDSAEKSALMVSVVYETGGSYRIARYNYDSDPVRVLENKFETALTTGLPLIEGKTLAYCSGDIILPVGTPYFLRINLLYNTSPVPAGVISLRRGSDPSVPIPALPTQGFCFESTATVIESGVTRKIKQCKLWPNLPNIFSWGLFSKEGDLGISN